MCLLLVALIPWVFGRNDVARSRRIRGQMHVVFISRPLG